MTRIFHITTADTWSAAQSQGGYAAGSLDSEGFIHCSDAQQVVWVANTRFRGRTDLILLQIDPQKLLAAVIYENLEGGTQLFPHVYGPINLDAVIATSGFTPAPDGSFDHHRGELAR